ncbi:uncharacterized protein UDID_18839 [Ustilago sp. UG-2017a]|nr:uncharacterized protein UDID_18839 [Ustilago sp. UG-2017a]
MNSLGLILLLSTLSALSAAFAQDCPPEYTAILPQNSEFNKACSADSATMSPCFHHVSGSLRSANIVFGSPYHVEDHSTLPGPIVKDGFLTDFTFVDNNRDYYINYTAEGLGLSYEPGNSNASPFRLGWGTSIAGARGWKLRAALANGGEELFDTSKASSGIIPAYGHVDLWLEKE